MRIVLVILIAVYITGFPHQLFSQGIEITKGLTFEATYIGEAASNVSGGAKRGSVYLHQIDLIGSADTEELGAWKGGTFFVYGFDLRGGSPTDLAGDFQVISNIDAPDGLLMYEAWYEHTFLDGRISLLGGLYGLDSEFDVIESASLFIQSSHGTGAELGASGANGPSIFPYSSLAIRLKAAISEGFLVQAAVLEAVPGIPGNNSGINVDWTPEEGLLLITEIALLSGHDHPTGAHPGGRNYRGVSRQKDPDYQNKLALGGWTYTRKFSGFDGGNGNRSRSSGVYIFGEASVYQESEGSAEGLTLFGRAGLATSAVNRLGAYTGGGAVYTGLIKGRPSDQLGAGIAVGINGDPYINNTTFNNIRSNRSETNLELTYLASVNNRISLQGDFQYVVNPNANPLLDNASIFLLRAILSL